MLVVSPEVGFEVPFPFLGIWGERDVCVLPSPLGGGRAFISHWFVVVSVSTSHPPPPPPSSCISAHGATRLPGAEASSLVNSCFRSF